SQSPMAFGAAFGAGAGLGASSSSSSSDQRSPPFLTGGRKSPNNMGAAGALEGVAGFLSSPLSSQSPSSLSSQSPESLCPGGGGSISIPGMTGIGGARIIEKQKTENRKQKTENR